MKTLIGLTALALALALGGCKPGTAGAEQSQSEFERGRMARINALRAEHAVLATQPHLISTMAQNFALTDDGRAVVDEKLSHFELRLDETKNLIEGLKNVDAADWNTREADVRDAMTKLHAARDAAWDALEDAPRAESPAS